MSTSIDQIAGFLRQSRRSAYYCQEFNIAVAMLTESTGEDIAKSIEAGTEKLTMKAIRTIAKMHPSLHKDLVAEARANRGRLKPRQYRDTDRAVEALRVAINDFHRKWPDECNGCTLAKALRYFADAIDESEVPQ